jgi:hypothetical protein
MKKILYLFLTVALIFSSCSKDDDTVAIVADLDIRDQLMGGFTGAGTITVTNLSDGVISPGANLGTFKCEKLGSSQINLIIEDFGPGDEDLTIPCNQITAVAGGLTFIIPDKDGIIMQNPDGSSGPPWILNGVSGPQNYNSADGSMTFSFEMENAQWMVEVTLTGTN